jgi:small subunit ribosomal protein S17
MADETENTEIEETPEAEEPAAEVEETPEADEPEVEEPAAEADPEPEAAEEPEPAAEETPAEAEPLAAEAEDSAPAEEEPAEETPAEEPVAVADEPAEETAAAAVSEPKKKRKRLPRSERPKKTRPKRVLSIERKPVTRLPKPESVRGRRQERQGVVVSDASDKTIVVRVDVVKLHPRYKKVVKRSTRLHAHDEGNEAKLGDVVRIVETRPLSRMKRWRLQEIVEAAK